MLSSWVLHDFVLEKNRNMKLWLRVSLTNVGTSIAFLNRVILREYNSLQGVLMRYYNAFLSLSLSIN